MVDGFPDTRLPVHGSPAGEVLDRMAELRADDRDWRGGRVFSLVYSAGHEVHELLERAADLYSAENALNTAVFPSLGWMQNDVVSITAGLLGADGLPADERAEVRGYLTSGGTESLLQATKTARDWGRAEGRIERPNIVVATSAHAAFEKAAHYFDVESRRVPVRDDFTADVDAMADAVDDHTVMIVGSAPSYPQGVIDPIPALAAVAVDRGILCHVDACLGGFILPFLDRLGHLGKRWDLTVPGVTSISADLHKYGYASKGISVIVYRSRAAGPAAAVHHHELAGRTLRIAVHGRHPPGRADRRGMGGPPPPGHGRVPPAGRGVVPGGGRAHLDRRLHPRPRPPRYARRHGGGVRRRSP